MKIVGIYKITSPTNRVYIGQSVDIKSRIRAYKGMRCKKQVKLYHSFFKHGFQNHKIEIICECEIDELNEKERYYQELYNSIAKGLNCVLTGTNDKSGKLSEETKRKISIATSNPSDETRLKMSNSHKGVKKSLESVTKTANGNRGKKRSLEVRMKLAEISRNISDETRLKKSLAAMGNKHSHETKRKISEAGKGRFQSDAKRLKIAEKLGKKVLNTETGEVFLSVAKAANSIGHNISWLHFKLKGLKKNNTNLIFYTNE